MQFRDKNNFTFYCESIKKCVFRTYIVFGIIV